MYKYFKLPYKPEKIQAEIHNSLKRFNVVVVSRGGGKSYLCAAELCTRAIECQDEKGALFLYISPVRQQGKDVLWGKLKYLVKDIPCKIREDELTIVFEHNNAIIKLEGSTDPDRLRGMHPHFVVLDEVGDMDRSTWYSVVLNFIDRHNATVVAIGTPKGHNLFEELYFQAKKNMDEGNPEWYALKKDVYQVGLLTEKQIEEKRKSMPITQWQQEQMCDFDAVFAGSFYSEVLLDTSRHIVDSVPYNPAYPVFTGWDLSTSAGTTSIWFCQVIDGFYNFIDFYENTGHDFYHYMAILKSKPYHYKDHIVPHDIAQQGWETKSTRAMVFQRCGFKTITAKKLGINEGIAIVQTNLYKSRFDKDKCGKGIIHLMDYKSKSDKFTGITTGDPDQGDQCSHAADALRTFFVGIRRTNNEDIPYWERGQQQKREVIDYDYFNWDSSPYLRMN